MAVSSWTGRALSEDAGPLVVLVTASPDAPFVRRLAAELALFGYRVEIELRGAAETELSELLTRSGGAALIAVDQDQKVAEVMVGQGGQGRTSYESERLDPRRGAETNAAILAERFRARLTELGIAPGVAQAPPSAPAPPPAAAPSPAPLAAPPADPRLWLWVAGGGTSGGLGLLPEAQLELRLFPRRWLSTSAFGRWSPWAAEVNAAEGQAQVQLISSGLLIDAHASRRGLDLGVGIGALVVAASMSGRAEAPWGGRQDLVLVPAAQIQGGVGGRLSRRISAELRAFVGITAPRVGVRFAGRNVADFGQPFVGASLGLGAGFF